MADECAANTDRELWREGDGDGNGMSYYEPSIHVTVQGGIGINVGGTVVVRTLREWMELALPSCPKCDSRVGHIHWCPRAGDSPLTQALGAAEVRVKELEQTVSDLRSHLTEVFTVSWASPRGTRTTATYTLSHLAGQHESGTSFLRWLLLDLKRDRCSSVTVSLDGGL